MKRALFSLLLLSGLAHADSLCSDKSGIDRTDCLESQLKHFDAQVPKQSKPALNHYRDSICKASMDERLKSGAVGSGANNLYLACKVKITQQHIDLINFLSGQ